MYIANAICCPRAISLFVSCVFILHFFFFATSHWNSWRGWRRNWENAKKKFIASCRWRISFFLAKFILYIYGIEKKKTMSILFFFFLQFPNPPRLSARRLLRACHYCKRKMETKKKKRHKFVGCNVKIKWISRQSSIYLRFLHSKYVFSIFQKFTAKVVFVVLSQRR